MPPTMSGIPWPSPATDPMTRHLFASALFAGLLTGLVAALMQAFLTVPVIHQAERYESGELVHFAGVAGSSAAGHDQAGHDHTDAAPAGDDHGGATFEPEGWLRVALTVSMDLVTYTGFALLLAAALAFAALRGLAIDLRVGLIFGLAGFAAVQLAPALGLAPELPGTPAADLALRQAWWVGTVTATAAGLALLAFLAGPARLAGLVLIALPHLVGAPVPAGFGGVIPPELAGLFAARVLGTGAVAWAVLGLATAWFWTRAPGGRAA
jgi:cobalt transporter subunit CbtA